jgi:hypothetical protein
MFAWQIQKSVLGSNLSTLVDLRDGAWISVTEHPVADRNVITADEIYVLEKSTKTLIATSVIPLRLYRFNMMDREGVITDEGLTALAHLKYERHGMTNDSPKSSAHNT